MILPGAGLLNFWTTEIVVSFYLFEFNSCTSWSMFGNFNALFGLDFWCLQNSNN